MYKYLQYTVIMKEVKPSNRLSTGKFKKGQSGNPDGRPKKDPELVEAAKVHTVAAIKTLAEIMKNKKTNAGARVQAACALLDRAHGKPVQMTELTGKDGGPIETQDMTPLELARRLSYHFNDGLKDT